MLLRAKLPLLFALCMLLVLWPQALEAQQGGPIKVIEVAGQPSLQASSAGIMAGTTLYIAAQDGRQADGSLPATFEQEASRALSHVSAVAHAAGMEMEDLVALRIYLTDVGQVNELNRVYWKMIGAKPATRTVLIIGALPYGAHIAIDGIAVASSVPRQVIQPSNWSIGAQTSPPGILAGDVLYISAQTGIDPHTGKLAADYAGEVKQALENVLTVLKAARMSMANVVWTNPYLASAGTGSAPNLPIGPIGHNGQAQDAQVSTMNKIYATYFEFGNTPGRGTTQIVGLPEHAHIAFVAIAGGDISLRRSIQIRNMKPSATASPGVLYRDTYYMSGKSGFIPDQGIVTQDIKLQLRQTMRNLLDDLQGLDLDFGDVVQASVCVREMKYAEDIVPLYETFFKGRYPAQSLMQNSFDLKTATGEQISFIAVRHSVE
jgi:enamine deaminase RidA (YjgF/YER057c/UK114 family)